MEIVRRILSLSNQPNLTEIELAERSKDWQDAFEGIIPRGRLNDAFQVALKKHTGTFPVNAFEILDAWKSIKPPPISETDFQKLLLEQEPK